MKSFSGVLTAIATPFDEKGNIDFKSFQNLITRLKTAGTHGIVVAGTTGESPTLEESEKRDLIAAALDHQGPDFKIYAGTGTNSTRETIARTGEAFEIRTSGKALDGAMVVVPYYNRPTTQGQKVHFSEILKAFPDKAFCLYNVPGRTAATLAPSAALELFESHSNCVAIKEAAGNLGVVAELARGLKERKLDRQLLSGDDPTFAPALLCGATGVISVSTHVIPKTMVAMWNAWLKNDLAKLQELHLKSLKLNTDLFCTPNPIGLKWMLSRLALCQNVLRLPLTPADEGNIRILEASLKTVSEGGWEN